MEFIDLKEQYRRYKDEIHGEMEKVLSAASFIQGPAVKEFEAALAAHTGAKHAIACASGTDALMLGLMAKDIKPGDEVLVPDFTFIATAEMVALMGAVPVFVDIDRDTYNIDPTLLEKKITAKTRGIIPVSLYGQAADMDEINAVAKKHGLWVMEDAAQSYGAGYKGKKSCNISEFSTTSFFPAKPLGCYGDGGAVFTNDDELAAKIRIILNHGQEKRYHHKYIGFNGRLDTLQAAVLKVKLAHFDEEMEAKQKAASWYTERLVGKVKLQKIRDYNYSVWAQYTCAHEKREKILENLKAKGIPTAIHYPIPLHRQEAFAYLGIGDTDYPVSVESSGKVFSLPMHPFMTEDQADTVANAVKEAIK
jgi:UDP-2-acetamido-2-deoxy-ribo-hexuluronate aminotransferase